MSADYIMDYTVYPYLNAQVENIIKLYCMPNGKVYAFERQQLLAYHHAKY